MNSLSLLPLLTLPLHAGVAILEDPDPPGATAIAASFEEQMQRVARHNIGLHRRLNEPSYEALFEGEFSEEACTRAIAHFRQLQEKEERAETYSELSAVMGSALSACALHPERRVLLARFLREGLAQGARRELCLYELLQHSWLSPANRELAEQLFRELPFDAAAFAQQLEAAFPGRRSGIAELCPYLLQRACLDLDSPDIAQRLDEQGALPRCIRGKNHVRAYLYGLRPFTPPERAQEFAQLSHRFFYNNYGPVRPDGNFLQRARLEQGMHPFWVVYAAAPETRAAEMLEALAAALEANAPTGQPGLRLVYLRMSDPGQSELWADIRCLDTQQKVSPDSLRLRDYQAEIKSGKTLRIELSDREDEEDEESQAAPDAARNDGCLALLRAEDMALGSVIDSLRQSTEIAAALAERLAPEDGQAERARLEWLGLIAVNDAARPWRWAACFSIPGAVEKEFVLQDGKWELIDSLSLCPCFRRDSERDEEFAGRSRLNCLYPPELTEEGKARLSEFARFEKESDAQEARLAALLQTVQDRASAEAAVEPLRLLLEEEKALDKRWPGWIEEEASKLTAEEFAPENMLSANRIFDMHGANAYREDAPYWVYYRELERVSGEKYYGVSTLQELLEPELHL